ncbi:MULTISPECIES: TniB family NTP-binding protein [unclassified Pseudomonas]|uniref:TniB family NTP-binding protein n=1 Tax=unclassified Pseudomonas TaxID=196821 RepID=UPI00072053C5|nr:MULTISPECIES: TniB family NTP-binding protein [unclassified Pseudomonas]OOG14638.1 hypothetical protein BMS17_21885 [Pseudomonas sp. C9]CRL51604.1 hypothetical protein PSHI_47970 [Pseudomonas sp. URMO17WK12:I11]
MNPTNEKKLKHFKTFTILHPQYREAVETIHRSIQATKLRGEPSCAVLLGDPGTGKTRVCHQILSEYARPSNVRTEAGLQDIRPSVYCRIPTQVTIKGVLISLLSCFETFSAYQSMGALEYRLMTVLKNCQTQLIILDELQHLLSRGAARTKETVCDWVKVLTDIFAGEVILAGTPDCEAIITAHSALAGRFPYSARLECFNLNTPESYEDFVKLLRAFSIRMKETFGFSEIPELTDEKMALAMYAFSSGNMRSIRTLLFQALNEALERDGELQLQDFKTAANHVKVNTKMTLKNPFELKLGELHKIVYKKSKK